MMTAKSEMVMAKTSVVVAADDAQKKRDFYLVDRTSWCFTFFFELVLFSLKSLTASAFAK